MQAKRIVVVGGGPAGMMAAISASRFPCEVTLIEKNPTLGKKLLLSGKGRCNLTNACELDLFLKRFSKNGQFLRDAFKKFFNLELMGFFEKRGLKLKVERQLRVFPVSDKSDSVLEILKKEIINNKVKIIYDSAMKDIFLEDNRVKGLLLSNGQSLPAGKVILATGGISYRSTGSTGEALEILERLGHKILPLRPGLVPLEIKGPYPKILEGLTLKNIRLKFSDGTRQIISEIGELLFTRSGISGPLVITLSGQITDWLAENKNVFVEIDLKPALSREQLDARLLREFKLNPKKSVKNTLKSLLPLRLIDVFLSISGINPDKKSSQITQVERQNFILLLKGLKLKISGARPIDEAMVTRGGVSLKEINPRTMESRLIHGLYFAGEMIDVDADTGGFNLQAAFSTGHLAGESAASN
ncbi:MAG: NAD(P)/FAD-dependent oxidoreductase [Candidatus Omnitrophica bacterium]|nr:NAD(P)/FAD-dependent oxidoreductase [Candidatus Omnitrophota bacterium]